MKELLLFLIGAGIGLLLVLVVGFLIVLIQKTNGKGW